MAQYAFGVDVGGTAVKFGFYEVGSGFLDTWEIRTRTEECGKYILADIAQSIDKTLSEKGIDRGSVCGLGIGVPGPVGADGMVYKCVNLGWDYFNVEDELSKLTNLKVKAGNDANVAALGEMWMGGGKGFQNLVMVTLGTGIGGGVILDGKIINGANGAVGEIGHIPVCDNEPETCGCGKHGCLEQYASAKGIARMAKKYLSEYHGTSCLGGITDVTSKDLFDAAKQGDAAALAIVDEFGRSLGKALASVSCVIDPEVFVIGGGLAKAGEIVIQTIQKYYVEYAFHVSRGTEFRLARLGNTAGITGGVKMVISDKAL